MTAAIVAGLSKLALYAAVGTELTEYDASVETAALVKHGSVTLPGNVQYVWPHPSRRYLYVAWSDGGPSGAAGRPTGGRNHGVHAFRIDPAGVLTPHGKPVALPSRPVHISADIPGTHLLVAHTEPSALTVWRIGADGTLGAEVKQPSTLDAGIYAHQVRVDPSNRSVILVTRGNAPTRDKPEDPGALKVYTYKDGLLANLASIAPGGGYNFQPRHLDFHPAKPWVYGTVHLHPNGKFVYQANRASGDAGENTIAVYSIDQKTGEPTLIQGIDTHGNSTRTFSLDPQAKILIAGNQVPAGSVPASMAVYRVGTDGKLTYVRKYDVEATNSKSLFWIGLIALP
jgi:6-phosphogluconolactonase (cycloisomerase 2 family)